MLNNDDIVFVSSDILYRFAENIHFVPADLENYNDEIYKQYSSLNSGYSCYSNMLDYLKLVEKQIFDLSKQFEELEKSAIERADFIKENLE